MMDRETMRDAVASRGTVGAGILLAHLGFVAVLMSAGVIKAPTLLTPASKSFTPAPSKKLVPLTLLKNAAVEPPLTRNRLPAFMVTVS